MKKTAVFVMSPPRSGSTWVGYVLASNADSAFLGEYYLAFNGYPQCNLCGARGHENCSLLGDFKAVSKAEAMRTAFERIQRPFLIDISKSVGWTKSFLGDPEFEVRCIQLIREPRGWYASHKRRSNWTVDEAINRWLSDNKRFTDFLIPRADEQLLSFTTVMYEDLTRDPHLFFSRLYSFLGLDFHVDALAYWNYEHHGPAGNGAAYNLFAGKPNLVKRPWILTADDPFYAERYRTSFRDERWRTELTHDEVQRIENDPRILKRLERYGRCWADFDRAALPEVNGD